jgi:heme-degrading monooxygenase HmoA
MAYARLLLLKLSPGNESAVQGLINKFDPLLKEKEGFLGTTYFSNKTTGESGSLVLWDSEENAESARAALFPKFKEAAKDMIAEPPRHPLFRVIEPEPSHA